MKRATAEERALARCTVYRFVAAALSYPTAESYEQLIGLAGVVPVAADLLDSEVAMGVGETVDVLVSTRRSDLEAAYQRSFTLSYSEECPLYETAFSARHLFQQTRHLADLSGFYTAFGVGAAQERPDHIAVQFEFCYLLALKEARARERRDDAGVEICRQAQRSFLRDHLARWAPLAGSRIRMAAVHPFYAAAGSLVTAVVRFDRRFLRIGAIETYRDEPDPGAFEAEAMTCPVADTAYSAMIERLQAAEVEHAAT